jgi:CBS domain-containing protein
MQVKEVMTRNPEKIRSSDPVKKAAELMKQLNVGAVPVVDGDRAVGILTDRDIALRVVAEGKDASATKAGDVMSREVITCSEIVDAIEVAKTMTRKQIRRLLVNDDQGNMVGIVSLGDLATSINTTAAGEVIREVSQPSEPAR